MHFDDATVDESLHLLHASRECVIADDDRHLLDSLSRAIDRHDHLNDGAFVYLRLTDHVVERLQVSPVVHELVELEVETLGKLLLLSNAIVLLELNQRISLLLNKLERLGELLGVVLGALVDGASCPLSCDKDRQDGQQLRVRQVVDQSREEELGEQHFILACLHGNFALEEDIEVLVDDVVVRQDGIAIVEISFLLVHIALKDLVDTLHLGSVLFLHL